MCLQCVDMWRQRDVPLTTPEDLDVHKYARHLERSKLTMDNTPVSITVVILSIS